MTLSPSVQIPPEKPITESAFAPALDNADMEMVNLVEVMTRQIIQETNKAVENKEVPKDPYVIAIMILGIAMYMVKNLVMPFVEKKKNGNNANKCEIDSQIAGQAHLIICAKDQDGIPILLSIPKHIRETVKIMQKVSDTIEKIESHFH